MAKLSRQRFEQLYSLFLIILIPACIIGSTVWLTSQVKANFDQELRRKANLANEVFGVSVANALTTNSTDKAASFIGSIIEQTRRQAPEIDQLGVSVPGPNGPKTIASSDPRFVNQSDTTIQTKVALAKQLPIASLIAAGESGTREWLVATPVFSESGSLIAVTTIRVSLASADAAVAATLRSSYWILGAMLVVIILLLLHHFRFVEYEELFRKQKELDQMKDDFISIATHELKAPMSVIRGYISMAQEETDPTQVNKMLAIAFAQTDRLGHLVTDLLDVSRLEQGRTKFTSAKVDLGATIEPMISVYAAKAKEKGLKLDYQKPAGLPLVVADPDRVGEIFTNLIDNAIKYSRAGTVTVSHTSDGTSVTTIVADTGIGMTADELGRLFQRFYRARNADTADIAGTGLGLWIIKQYAEHMGGQIRVESEKGKGSRFIVVLPKVK